MKHLSPMLFFLLALGLTVGLAGSSQGVSHAQPGGVAIIKLELKPDSDVLLNRLGPSRIRVLNPFGKALEAGLPKGTPWPQEPETYDQSVPPLAFRLNLPGNTKPGAYPVRIEAELFLCDAVKHVCYRSNLTSSVTLRVGSQGQDQAAVLELKKP
jgi:hypothetical protein